ncbi:MAG TPA: transposase, partial [Cytophagales bacterium]|nr:transposase [Cytophagales bacterium]
TEEGPAWSMSNQKFNDKLKLVAQAAGLQDWRKITSHVGRHSCATILLNMGMEIHMVQKILAHNDIKTTQIYAKMETESVDRELSGLDWGMKD